MFPQNHQTFEAQVLTRFHLLISYSNYRPHPAACHENHRLTLNLMRVETPLMVGKHYNLDRSRCFYATLLDLAEPKEPHREISQLLNTGHEQKMVE